MEHYKGYYINNGKLVVGSIRDLESREIAYINFDGVMLRHIMIPETEFNEWLITHLPKDLYHSISYYLFPDKPIEDKVWRGGDLVFDIDLDHIPTYKPRYIWLCERCKEIYREEKAICEKCNGKPRKILLPDIKGLTIAKKETFKLLDIIERKIDLPIDEMHIFFSGGRGYHIHIYSDDLVSLDSRARIEIKDYITLDGFDIMNLHYSNISYIQAVMKDIGEGGQVVNEYFTKSEIDYMLSIYKNIDKIGLLKEKLKKRRKLREKINRYIRERYGVHIDGVVTTDISRLIRAPYSVHGKTGLIKKRIGYQDLDEFIPYRDSVISGEEVYVNVIYLPNLIWGDREYDEKYHERIKLPLSLAVFLINMGLAYDTRRI